MNMFVASVSAVAVATPVDLAASPIDLIVAAIERHRQLEAEYSAACAADSDDELCGSLIARAEDALADLVRMTPTTAAGCAAALRHVEGHVRAYEQGRLFEGFADVEGPASDFLSRIASTLDGDLARSVAPAPVAAVARSSADPIFAAIDRHEQAHNAFAALCGGSGGSGRKWKKASHAADEAAWALIEECAPTTVAGAAALLQYAHDYVARGDQWPDLPCWASEMHRVVAVALAGLSAVG